VNPIGIASCLSILKGAFFLICAAIPHLTRSHGVVINIASDAGLVGNKGAAVYCASKGGLVLLTKSLALELARSVFVSRGLPRRRGYSDARVPGGTIRRRRSKRLRTATARTLSAR